jgi:hypothetical protein
MIAVIDPELARQMIPAANKTKAVRRRPSVPSISTAVATKIIKHAYQPRTFLWMKTPRIAPSGMLARLGDTTDIITLRTIQAPKVTNNRNSNCLGVKRIART